MLVKIHLTPSFPIINLFRYLTMFRNCVKYDVAKDCLLVSQRPLDIRITSKFSLEQRNDLTLLSTKFRRYSNVLYPLGWL